MFLFKEIYNNECETEDSYKIHKTRLYDLNECINSNINYINNHYLLLETKPSLASLIYQNIKIQNPYKTIAFYDGRPFVDDNNNNKYRFKIINEIKDNVKTDKLIILQNLNQFNHFYMIYTIWIT